MKPLTASIFTKPYLINPFSYTYSTAYS